MVAFLGTDPGAGNIIVWMLVLGAIGATMLWVATTYLLRGGGPKTLDQREPDRS